MARGVLEIESHRTKVDEHELDPIYDNLIANMEPETSSQPKGDKG